MIDGDTVCLTVDLGLRVLRTLEVRIARIDAPEVTGANKEAGLAAKEALGSIFEKHFWACHVRFAKGMSFDRWIGELIVFDGTHAGGLDVGAMMVEAGHARWSTP